MKARTTVCASPTASRSASWKIGALGSVLIATIRAASFHTDSVLWRTADPDGDVDVGIDRLPGLADLDAERRPPRVDDRARRTDGGAADSVAASSSSSARPSRSWRPRPPATTTRASSSFGPPARSSWRSSRRTRFRSSGIATSTATTSASPPLLRRERPRSDDWRTAGARADERGAPTWIGKALAGLSVP
jgi:hypothetical protein